MCSEPCKKNQAQQAAIFCDQSYNNWIHFKCSQLSKVQFKDLSSLSLNCYSDTFPIQNESNINFIDSTTNRTSLEIHFSTRNDLDRKVKIGQFVG